MHAIMEKKHEERKEGGREGMREERKQGEGKNWMERESEKEKREGVKGRMTVVMERDEGRKDMKASISISKLP